MHSRSSITRRLSLVLASSIILLVHSMANAQENSYKASFKMKTEPIARVKGVGAARTTKTIASAKPRGTRIRCKNRFRFSLSASILRVALPSRRLYRERPAHD